MWRLHNDVTFLGTKTKQFTNFWVVFALFFTLDNYT